MKRTRQFSTLDGRTRTISRGEKLQEWAFDNEMHDMVAFSAEAIKAGDSPTVEATKWLTGFVRDYSMFHPILDRR